MNIFKTLGVRQEIFHSRMLRWLWDPRGDHGAGTAFLEPFLKRIDLAFSDGLSLATEVKLDVPDTKRWRLADIVLRLEDAFVLVENKVDPDYQDADQVFEEIQSGRLLAESEDRQFVFTLLSPHVSQPVRDAVSKEGGHHVSWSDLIADYEGVDMQALDPVVAAVIQQYLEFVRRLPTDTAATDPMVSEAAGVIDGLIADLEIGQVITAPELWQLLVDNHPGHASALEARWVDSSHYSSKAWFASRLQRIAAAGACLQDTGEWRTAPAGWGYPEVRVYKRVP